jgi:ParB-like chromosome segregation protein Spo0J
MTASFPLHPAAEIFPVMDDEAFAALVADIAAHGQREPILVLDGQLIDGRHRLRACAQLGLEPLVREITADEGEPFSLVVSLNLQRRHLSESQRAMVAAQLAQRSPGNRTGNNQHERKAANLPDSSLTQPQAAQLLNVSERSVRHAVEIKNAGTPELIAAVQAGQLPVSTAAQLAQLPAQDQRAALTKTPTEIRAIAREVKARIQAAGVCGPSAVRIFEEVAADQQLGGIEQCAVVAAIQADEAPLPTPSEAKRIACAGAPGLMVLASDGRYHTAPGDPEENARLERWLRLREGLELLATVPFPPSVAVDAIPSYQHKNVSDWLARAVPFVNQLHQLWSQHHAS